MKAKPISNEILDAKRIVERLLKYRLRSARELVAKLKAKQITGATIEKTLDYYKQIGIVDDVLFTRGWINSRLNKPMGINRIRWELRHKGIDPEIINQELNRVLGDYDEQEAADKIARKRFLQYQRINLLKAKRRLMSYLMRRGFAMETVRRVVRDIGKTSDDDRERS